MLRKIFATILLGITLCYNLTTFASESLQRVEAVSAEIISSHTNIVAGGEITLGVRFKMDKDWHIYWKNPGDSGLPTKVEWNLPTGFMASDVVYPVPSPIFIDPLMNYGYENEVVLFSTIAVPENIKDSVVPLSATASWLMCKQVCIPGSVNITLTLPVASQPMQSPSLKHIQNQNIITQTYNLPIFETDNNYIIPLPIKQDFIFIPHVEGVINDEAKQTYNTYQDEYYLVVPKDNSSFTTKIDKLSGVLLSKNKEQSLKFIANHTSPIPTNFFATNNNPTSTSNSNLTPLLIAIFSALIAGIILNLMPCVLPVLAIKIMGLIHHAKGEKSWVYGLIYTAGVLTSFALMASIVIGFKTAGISFGWGFQLQNPAFVATLTLIILLISLELFGVYEIGASLGKLESKLANKNGIATTFWSGALITLVATPCTAPFMGGAIAYSLASEAHITYAIFLALGFGLALPYLVLTFSPRLLKYLPKSGKWMETLRQFLGFPMLATAIWLVWVYGKQTSVDSMTALIVMLFAVALSAWIFSKLVNNQNTFRKQIIGIFIFITVIAGYLATIWGEPKTSDDLIWQKWAPSKVEEAITKNQPVFINFTADWCITCKVNEAIAFDNDKIKNLFKQNNVLLLEGDWTLYDQHITDELDRHNRKGVPLYLYYDGQNPSPQILPQILTTGIVEEAINGKYK